MRAYTLLLLAALAHTAPLPPRTDVVPPDEPLRAGLGAPWAGLPDMEDVIEELRNRCAVSVCGRRACSWTVCGQSWGDVFVGLSEGEGVRAVRAFVCILRPRAQAARGDVTLRIFSARGLVPRGRAARAPHSRHRRVGEGQAHAAVSVHIGRMAGKVTKKYHVCTSSPKMGDMTSRRHLGKSTLPLAPEKMKEVCRRWLAE